MCDREKAKKALSHPGTWASNGKNRDRIVTRWYEEEKYECEDCNSGLVFNTDDIDLALNFLETGKVPGIVKIA